VYRSFALSTALEHLKHQNEDQKAGINIVRRAIQAPGPGSSQANAGGGRRCRPLGRSLRKKDYNWGYNAQTGEYVDLVAAGCDSIP